MARLRVSTDNSARDPARRVRPKDAASLIIVRRIGGEVRFLTGRRSHRHVFMPGLTVFPGGGVERQDYRRATGDALAAPVEARLLSRLSGRSSPARARAIAQAAVRETAEEAGILVGDPGLDGGTGWPVFERHEISPRLSPLRLVARAITPPNLVRRFDARFFAVFEESVARQVPPDTDELFDFAWLSAVETAEVPMPPITRRVIATLTDRLSRDPQLEADESIPFYYTRRNRPLCEWI